MNINSFRVNQFRAGAAVLAAIVSAWFLTASAQEDTITKVADSGNQAGAIDGGARAVSTSQFVLTAVRLAGSQRLRLITWTIGLDGKPITRQADSGNQAGAIGFDFAVINPAPGAVTAVRVASTNILRLIAWNINIIGDPIVRVGDSGNQAGEIKEPLGMAPVGQFAATAVITASGNLKLISWPGILIRLHRAERRQR